MTSNAEPRAGNPHAAIDAAAAAFVNHLLRGASWARETLARHAGKTARFEVFPVAVTLKIQDSGEVAPAGADTTLPAATARLSPGLALRLAARDESAWREIDIAGDTDLASAIHHVARNLRWDVEEDLSRIFGDVAAHRMAETGRTVRRWGEQAAMNTGRAFAEYWTEEQPLIAGARDLEEFGKAVDELRDDAARLEKQFEKLLNRQGATTPGNTR